MGCVVDGAKGRWVGGRGWHPRWSGGAHPEMALDDEN